MIPLGNNLKTYGHWVPDLQGGFVRFSGMRGVGDKLTPTDITLFLSVDKMTLLLGGCQDCLLGKSDINTLKYDCCGYWPMDDIHTMSGLSVRRHANYPTVYCVSVSARNRENTIYIINSDVSKVVLDVQLARMSKTLEQWKKSSKIIE